MGIKFIEDFVTVPVSLESNGDLVTYIGVTEYRVHTGVVGLSLPIQNNYFIENSILAFLMDEKWSVIIWHTGEFVVLYKNKLYDRGYYAISLPGFSNAICIAVDRELESALRVSWDKQMSTAIFAADKNPVVMYTNSDICIGCAARMSERAQDYDFTVSGINFNVWNRYTGSVLLTDLQYLCSGRNIAVGGVCCGKRIQYSKMRLED